MTLERTNAGFTLTELMVTVAIIGILASVAIPAFGSQRARARISEGTGSLQEIRQKQEAYRAKNGQYLKVSNGAGSTQWSAAQYFPPGAPNASKAPWPTSGGIADRWRTLGFHSTGGSYFRFACLAGSPSDPYPGATVPATAFWFRARALGDLDGDGTTFFLEVSEDSSRVFNSAFTSWE